MDEATIKLPTTGLTIPVRDGAGSAQDGISFGQTGPHVAVVLTSGGRQLSVWLSGDTLDYVAGLFADAVSAATRFEAPSLGSVQ